MGQLEIKKVIGSASWWVIH